MLAAHFAFVRCSLATDSTPCLIYLFYAMIMPFVSLMNFMLLPLPTFFFEFPPVCGINSLYVIPSPCLPTPACASCCPLLMRAWCFAARFHAQGVKTCMTCNKLWIKVNVNLPFHPPFCRQCPLQALQVPVWIPCGLFLISLSLFLTRINCTTCTSL